MEEDRLHAEAIEAEENEEVLTEQPPENFVSAPVDDDVVVLVSDEGVEIKE